MKQIGLIVIVLIFSEIVNGQNYDCNQAFIGGKLKEPIPKDVCIPMNFHIREIKKSVDLNLDGLKDYIFSFSKVNIADGDTMFVAVYIMQADSSYVLLKRFDNLYPIVFRDYSLSYNIKDSLLNELQGMYSGFYPLISIKFLEGEIQIKLKQGFQEFHTLHFLYNKENGNWYLTESEMLFGYEENKEPVKITYKVGEQLPIDKFNFFDWL